MGFIAKQRTKSRTAPSAHATTLSTDWADVGMPQLAAIVRAAACSVGGRRNLRSSGFRGHDTLGIGSAMRSGNSTLWYEQIGYGTWKVAMGLDTVKGPALDWSLTLRSLGAEGGTTVEISTPAVLTKDGAQVHKDEYLETRELVTAGLTAPVPPSTEPERAAATTGLNFRTHPFAQPPATPFDGSFAVETSLSEAAVAECLESVHFPRASDSAEPRWLIGLPSAVHRSWATASTVDEGARRRVTFAVRLAHNDEQLVNAVTTLQARRFAALAHGLIRARDAGASMTGGGGLLDDDR